MQFFLVYLHPTYGRWGSTSSVTVTNLTEIISYNFSSVVGYHFDSYTSSTNGWILLTEVCSNAFRDGNQNIKYHPVKIRTTEIRTILLTVYCDVVHYADTVILRTTINFASDTLNMI